jgi:hypothetical protein
MPAPVVAHKPSDSYLTLTVAGDRIEGRWDIALRDLDHAIGLDLDQDGALTWSEVKQRHRAIEAYALARLSLTTSAGACLPRAGPQLVENHSDGAYTVLPFAADCRDVDGGLAVRYRAFFDLDPLHRGLLRVHDGDTTATAILSPEAPSFAWRTGQGASLGSFLTYVRDGVRHILIGFDHILFLICLLLPAGLRREGRAWRRVDTWRDAMWPVVHIVTAFTIAHSLTLAAAAMGLVALPSRLVESAIAATVVAAALNNIWPVVTRRLWMVAFGFGLVHGFGFAGVLADLGLPRDALALSLLGFNLGVELGQMTIVAMALPLIYGVRGFRPYRRLILPAGSAATAAVAALWLVERGLQIPVL